MKRPTYGREVVWTPHSIDINDKKTPIFLDFTFIKIERLRARSPGTKLFLSSQKFVIVAFI